jgi:hypothetical protein
MLKKLLAIKDRCNSLSKSRLLACVDRSPIEYVILVLLVFLTKGLVLLALSNKKLVSLVNISNLYSTYNN